MRTRAVPALATLALCGALAAGCSPQGPPPPDVVARLAHSDIPYGEFESYLKRNSFDLEVALASEVLSGLFDQFIEEELIRALALERGVADAEATSAVALAALVAEAGAARVDEAAVADYYASHRELFERPERVRLRQILVEDRARGQQALAALASGTPFAEVAAAFSQEPGASRGGDQGLLTREDLPPAFVETVFSLAPGEVSELVAAGYGFHLFEVTERLPAETVPLATAAPEIRALLTRDAAFELERELVRRAADRYNPQVFGRNLPFNYEGRYASEN